MPSLRSRRQRNSRQRSSRRQRNSRQRNSRQRNSRNSRRNSRSQRGGNGWSAQQSLNQGKEFASFHTNQHGGAQVPLGGAPVDHDSVLPGEMRDSAGLAQADGHFRAVGGMSDAAAPAPAQKGGRRNSRRNRSRNSRSRNSRNRNSRNSRNRNSRNRNSRNRNRNSRNRNRQSGGSHSGFNGAPVSNSFNLLESGQYSKAGTADFSNPLLLK